MLTDLATGGRVGCYEGLYNRDDKEPNLVGIKIWVTGIFGDKFLSAL